VVILERHCGPRRLRDDHDDDESILVFINDALMLVCADVVLPEGVDPSFLAALPENIRQEVIMEQLRLQRIQQRAQQVQQEAQSLGVTEVNPDFLAALPPHIQEEVCFRNIPVCWSVKSVIWLLLLESCQNHNGRFANFFIICCN